jgi:hypothetical protein
MLSSYSICHYVETMLSCGIIVCGGGMCGINVCGGRMLSCVINVLMWGSNVIMWDHVGVKCYHGGSILSCGMKYYHVR